MKFSRLFLNRLQDRPHVADTVVVVDVLRSFTTMAVALANGARAIYPVEGVAAAQQLATRLGHPVTVGSVGGGDPIPGFDYGNSPAQLRDVDLTGRDVVMSTAAGVRALQKFRRARRLYAASLVCARATAEAIRMEEADEVCFIITGEWIDRDGDEDIACADYIEALLRGESADPERYGERVRASSFGKRFMSGAWKNLPADDLDLASHADRYEFSMPVRSEKEQLVIP